MRQVATYYLRNNLLISSRHCELFTLKLYNTIFRLFLSEQQPASALYLKLCAICTKSAASHYKAFGNVSLALILVHFGDDICIFGLWWFWLQYCETDLYNVCKVDATFDFTRWVVLNVFRKLKCFTRLEHLWLLGNWETIEINFL